MNDINSIISKFAEDLSSLILKLENAPHEKQLLLFNEGANCFNSILEIKSQEISSSEIVLTSINNFFEAISKNISAILVDQNETKKFSDFLLKFLPTKLAYKCVYSITRTMSNLFSINVNDPQVLNPYVPALNKFFSFKAFRFCIIKSNFIDCIIQSFFGENKNILSTLVIKKISKYAAFYTDAKTKKFLLQFLQNITPLIPGLDPEKMSIIADMMNEIHKTNTAEFTIIFNKLGIINCFAKNVSKCTIEGNNILLTVILNCAKSAPIFIQENELSNPLKNVFSVFFDESIDQFVRNECMKYFLELASNVNKVNNPFTSQQVVKMSEFIPINDIETIKIFIQLCFNLQKRMDYNFAQLLPSFGKIFRNYQVLMDNDLSDLISTYIETNNDNIQIILDFFSPLFDEISSDQFAALFDKYEVFYQIFESAIENFSEKSQSGKLIYQFLTAFPSIKNKDKAKLSFQKAYVEKKGYRYINYCLIAIEALLNQSSQQLDPHCNELCDISDDALSQAKRMFLMISECTVVNQEFYQACIKDNAPDQLVSLYSKYKLPSSLILNFISSLADHSYLPELDKQTYVALYKNNFIDASPDELLDFALGLQIGEERNSGNLCFPSLVWKCANYHFQYAFDLWICGHVSLDVWLRDSKRPISEFPCIEEIARQYIYPKHIQMLINSPSVLEEISKGDFLYTPLFEFAPIKSNLLLSISSNIDSVSCSFWLKFKNLTDDITKIATIGKSILSIQNEHLMIDDYVIATIIREEWNFFVLTLDDQKENVIYINTQLIPKFKLKVNPFKTIVFESQKSNILWYIGGAVRLFSHSISEQQIVELYSLGINHTDHSFLNETVVYSPYNLIPLFKKFDTNVFQKTRPILNYSLIHYIEFVLKGLDPIYGKAIEKLVNTDYKSSASYLRALCHLQKNPSVCWSNKDFALKMSVICNFETEIVTMDLITMICDCFISRSFYYSNINTQLSHSRSKLSLESMAKTRSGLSSGTISANISAGGSTNVSPTSSFNNLPSLSEMSSLSSSCLISSYTINSTFSHNNSPKFGFDWDSFFKFILDYRFFYSELEPDIVKLISSYYSKYPFTLAYNSPLNSIFSNFLLTIVLLPDFNQEYRSNIYELIYQFVNDTSIILRYIVSAQDFTYDLTDYSMQYAVKTNNTLTTELLLPLFLSLNLKKFNEYYVLDCLEPHQAFMIIDHLKQSLNHSSNQAHPQSPSIFNNSTSEAGIDEDSLLKYCMRNTSIIESWDYALSLFLQKNILMKAFNFDFSHLLRMIMFLTFGAIHLPKSNFWNEFCQNIWKALPELVDKIEDPTPLYPILFTIMTLGIPIKSQSNFPLAPQIETDDEIFTCSQNRGQIYPKQDPVPFDMPKFKPNITSSDIPNITQALPEKFYLTEKVSFNMDIRAKELAYIIVDKQTNGFYINWNELVERNNNKFISDDTKSSVIVDILANIQDMEIASLISDFLVQLILKFPTTIEHIIPNNVYFDPKLSLYWIKTITFKLLNIFYQNGSFILSIIDYICFRLSEGFFASCYVEIMKLMFSILKKSKQPFPKIFYHLIWLSLNTISNEQLEDICKLIEENESVLFPQESYEIVWHAFSIIRRCITILPFLPASMSTIWIHYFDKLKVNEIFINKCNRKYPNINFKVIFDGLHILCTDGYEKYNEWKTGMIDNNTEEGESLLEFDVIMPTNKEKEEKKTKDQLKASLAKFVQQYEKNGELFIHYTNKLISFDVIQKVRSNATAVTIRYYTRRALLTRVEYYMRIRENALVKAFPFNPNKTTNRFCLTLLHDPIYPPRRYIPSPIEYAEPSFPNGTADNIFDFIPDIKFEWGRLPECILEKITICRIRSPSFIHYCAFPTIMPRFIGDCGSVPSIEYFILLETFGINEKNISYICETFFLFGVDCLEGTLMLTKDKIYFFEGCKIRNKSVFQIHSYENSLSQELYLQLFQSGFFSHNLYTFKSHYVLVSDRNTLISITNHLWLQRPYSLTLNFSLGYHYVLIFSSSTYNEAYNHLKSAVDSSLEGAPPLMSARTPIMSALLLQNKLSKLTQMWVDGELDNFTYICIVNRFAKRCYADLTQYPVLPWVLSDYQSENLLPDSSTPVFRDLTKPMGQLSPERAKRFDLVFQNSEPSYYYGTHYMHFGVVTYFMFRIDPFSVFFFLLHRGWDHPNRLFTKVLETWLSASTTTPSDVKELIPHMYKVPEMLTNISHLPLIVSDKQDIGNVVLPIWAKNPRHFSLLLTKFFEENYVTKNLSSWIDLIFGVNSRGQGALNCKNVFHPTCYPDSSDLQDIIDHVAKNAMIASIINFGQCSPQIFQKPHPTAQPSQKRGHLLSKSENIVYQRIKFPNNASSFISVSIVNDELAFIYDPANIILPTGQILKFHDRTIKSASISSDGYFVCKVFIDGHISISTLRYNNTGGRSSVEENVITNHQCPINGKISAISSAHFITFVSFGKVVMQYDIGTQRILPKLIFKYNVSFISIDDDAALVWFAGSRNISLYSISGQPLIEDVFDVEITSIASSPLPEHYHNRAAIVGFANGSISFIAPRLSDNKFVTIFQILPKPTTVIKKKKGWFLSKKEKTEEVEPEQQPKPIIAVAFDHKGRRAVAISKEIVFEFEYIDSEEKPLNTKYYRDCAICGNSPKSCSECPKCNRFICSKCLSRDSFIGAVIGGKLCNYCKGLTQQQENPTAQPQ